MKPPRKVGGKPARNPAGATRTLGRLRSWGWRELRVEPRAGGEYFVVTGIPPVDTDALNGKRGTKTSLPGVLGRRYRWP